ncbi:MAG: hypothetical protein M1828_004076 [Chrysothrix sp. TS-e1954]|nr:MAG: hypothetical protein M1828_004076 [Chrysothrix sp. TS-e1954]
MYPSDKPGPESEGLQVAASSTDDKIARVQDENDKFIVQPSRQPGKTASMQDTAWTNKRLKEQSQTKRTICGLSVGAFWIVSTVLVVVLAGAIGGGIGGGLASQKKNCSPETSQASSSSTTNGTSASGNATTNYVEPDPLSIQTLHLDCPARDQSVYQALAHQQFTVHCDSDVQANNTGPADTPYNIVAIRSFSIDDCMEGCASYNAYIHNTTCVAIAFSPNMADAINRNFGKSQHLQSDPVWNWGSTN